MTEHRQDMSETLQRRIGLANSANAGGLVSEAVLYADISGRAIPFPQVPSAEKLLARLDELTLSGNPVAAIELSCLSWLLERDERVNGESAAFAVESSLHAAQKISEAIRSFDGGSLIGELSRSPTKASKSAILIMALLTRRLTLPSGALNEEGVSHAFSVFGMDMPTFNMALDALNKSEVRFLLKGLPPVGEIAVLPDALNKLSNGSVAEISESLLLESTREELSDDYFGWSMLHYASLNPSHGVARLLSMSPSIKAAFADKKWDVSPSGIMKFVGMSSESVAFMETICLDRGVSATRKKATSV